MSLTNCEEFVLTAGLKKVHDVYLPQMCPVVASFYFNNLFFEHA